MSKMTKQGILFLKIFKINVGLCSAEFPNCFTLRPATVGSAAASISIYNAIKSAAVSRITNPDTLCGRIANAPEPVVDFQARYFPSVILRVFVSVCLKKRYQIFVRFAWIFVLYSSVLEWKSRTIKSR